MKLPEFVLIAFEASDFSIDPTTSVRGGGRDAWIKGWIDARLGESAKINAGTYVLKSKDSFGPLSVMMQEFRTQSKDITVTFFEESLFGHFQTSVAQRLQEFGVAVHNINLEPLRQAR